MTLKELRASMARDEGAPPLPIEVILLYRQQHAARWLWPCDGFKRWCEACRLADRLIGKTALWKQEAP
jgi:hypothetical protein